LNFAPSRFVGYQDVTFSKHQSPKEKLDGRLTNPAITAALGVPLVQDIYLDLAYERFLRGLGYAGGIHNNKRKYWLTDAALAALSQKHTEVEEIIGSSETQKATLIQARIGQERFRRALMEFWQGCAVTGCKLFSALRASHIRPWKDSTDAQRLDPNNGLLLTSNLDALFDSGLISFDEIGTVIVSNELSANDREILVPAKIRRIPISPERGDYLKYHRENIFRNGGLMYKDRSRAAAI